MRKALSPKKEFLPKSANENEGNKLDDDDHLLNEMEELTHIMDRKKKRAKKILAKRRAKVSLVQTTVFEGVDLLYF